MYQPDHPLKIARLTKGLTLYQLYQMSGVHPGTISRIETRKRRGAIETYKKLAIALDCDWPELVEDK